MHREQVPNDNTEYGCINKLQIPKLVFLQGRFEHHDLVEDSEFSHRHHECSHEAQGQRAKLLDRGTLKDEHTFTNTNMTTKGEKSITNKRGGIEIR